MKLALVSGDGLPVSGLLTVFRNVLDVMRHAGEIDLPIPADFGYSWRPDKPHFFPAGDASTTYPDWLTVTRAVPVSDDPLGDELAEIRRDVAIAAELSAARSAELRERIDRLAAPYRRYFRDWFEEHRVDWVIAVNMTISDAVPVSLGLHQAVADVWSGARPGGILFWDHDLFGSYAVRDSGGRVYPPRPNAFTPLPGMFPKQRWAVISEDLAREASSYPTSLRPVIVPNVLPDIPPGALTDRHREFMAQQELVPRRPVILVPVRLFPVKGVELSLELLAALRRACAGRDEPFPYLLVFGSLSEDPAYARDVVAAADALRIHEDVRFLDGVPLASYRDRHGAWHLDEVDLLHLAREAGGAVFFTPSCADVESVGLGPALAAVAGVPCAVTRFNAFSHIYGPTFRCVHVERRDLASAADEMLNWLVGCREGRPDFLAALERNRVHVTRAFRAAAWRRLFEELSEALEPRVQLAQ